MSFFTKAKKKHNAGRAHLSKEEQKIKGARWYCSRDWLQKKLEIATKVKKRVARATSRRIARELEANKHYV